MALFYCFKILFDDKTHFLSLIFKFIFLRGRGILKNPPLQPLKPPKECFFKRLWLAFCKIFLIVKNALNIF